MPTPRLNEVFRIREDVNKDFSWKELQRKYPEPAAQFLDFLDSMDDKEGRWTPAEQLPPDKFEFAAGKDGYIVATGLKIEADFPSMLFIPKEDCWYLEDDLPSGLDFTDIMHDMFHGDPYED